ncbi:nucleotidyltransferase substrate binding protein [Patescibacteria group bacterium]|nr:nucleotidyltransferase substrate binding protein [Patescibacteria group bacterium]
MSIEEVILKDFKKTIGRLEEVLRLRKTKIIRDSAIKRFELCFDLAWKSIKVYAKNQNVECVSPRDCIKTAFQLKLIRPVYNNFSLRNEAISSEKCKGRGGYMT